jgi:hypothetical protein
LLYRSVSESLLEMENFDDPMLSPTGNNYREGNCAVCSSPEYSASFCRCTGGSIRKAAMEAAVAKFAPRPLSDDSGNESAKSTSSRETIGNDYCMNQMIIKI